MKLDCCSVQKLREKFSEFLIYFFIGFAISSFTA
jgi:hypothetical protein